MRRCSNIVGERSSASHYDISYALFTNNWRWLNNAIVPNIFISQDIAYWLIGTPRERKQKNQKKKNIGVIKLNAFTADAM